MLVVDEGPDSLVEAGGAGHQLGAVHLEAPAGRAEPVGLAEVAPLYWPIDQTPSGMVWIAPLQ